jgi:hypothetical protein
MMALFLPRLAAKRLNCEDKLGTRAGIQRVDVGVPRRLPEQKALAIGRPARTIRLLTRNNFAHLAASRRHHPNMRRLRAPQLGFGFIALLPRGAGLQLRSSGASAIATEADGPIWSPDGKNIHSSCMPYYSSALPPLERVQARQA